jgi:hypothetical protein
MPISQSKDWGRDFFTEADNLDADGHELDTLSVSDTNKLTPSPEKNLALAILSNAKEQAENGSVSALVFLLLDGTALEKFLLPDLPEVPEGTRSPVLAFCQQTWEKMQCGEIQCEFTTEREMRDMLSKIKRNLQKIRDLKKQFSFSNLLDDQG